jgi:hypothetical protein
MKTQISSPKILLVLKFDLNKIDKTKEISVLLIFKSIQGHIQF